MENSEVEKFEPDEEKYLLGLARGALESVVCGKKMPGPDSLAPKYMQERGCFVTLTSSGRLRGCIGNIEPAGPLYESVMSNAVNAGMYDPRFPKVNASELACINIEISVLTTPRPLKFSSPEDLLLKLQPCVHGVILKHGLHRSTFLPHVWEQLPDKITFLEHLSLKAGVDKDGWKSAEVWVYETVHFNE
ncbi:MAG: AmmeMemoRadiSam system protein A [Chitinispirillales bacterium]|nr:AmmeMemoRadiSam system protein A [Chitinispirillales bacterium]